LVFFPSFFSLLWRVPIFLTFSFNWLKVHGLENFEKFASMELLFQLMALVFLCFSSVSGVEQDETLKRPGTL
jgi:hypothetical protein